MLKSKGPVLAIACFCLQLLLLLLLVFFFPRLSHPHLPPSLNPLPKGEAVAAGAPKRLEPPAADPAGGAVSEKVGAEVGAADCPNPPNAPPGAVDAAGVLPNPPNPPVLAAGCPKRDDPAVEVAGAADPKSPPVVAGVVVDPKSPEVAGAAEVADPPPKKLPPKAGLAAVEAKAEAAVAGAFAPAADPGRRVSFAISLNDF